MNPDITKMTVTELKALAYDQLALLEQTQKNINIIKQQIESKLKAEQAKEPLEVKDSKEDKK